MVPRPGSACTWLATFALSIAAAGQPTTERIRAWLEGEIAAAKAFDGFHGRAIRFDEFYHPEHTRESLHALKNDIRDKPDHPEHNRIAAHERRLDRGPDAQAWTVWGDGSGRWRINKTPDYAS